MLGCVGQQPSNPYAYSAAGLAAAVARLEISRLQPDSGAAFVALGESMLWAMVLDERFLTEKGGYRTARQNLASGKLTQGVRYAWNLLKHAAVDDLVDVTPGVTFPIEFPMTFFEVRWRELAALPTPGRIQPVQRQHYVNGLEGKPVRLTFLHVASFLRSFI